MKRALISLTAAGCIAAALATLPGIAAAQTVPQHVSAAVADTSRPQADRDRDANRKPAELVAFAGIKPGDKVLELLPGGGYFTRIFSKVVGSSGRVYTLGFRDSEDMKKLAADPAYRNVSFEVTSADKIRAPEPVDVVWTSLNYHDMKNIRLESGGDAIALANKAAFDALEPGGVYIVVDHAAAAGAPADVTNTLHRIDPEVVKREVQAAGFRLESESNLLRNPQDPRTARPFDPSIRGETDQFVLKFRKPAR